MSASGGVSVARNRTTDRFYNPPAARRHSQMFQQLQTPTKSKGLASEDRTATDDWSSACSVSSPGSSGLTNLDRFLEYTTPVVPAHYLSETSIKEWRSGEEVHHPFFVLGDLWEAFKEWSAYGAGVPLLLNGKDSVVQYYVPYLSAIQLYIDSKPPSSLRSGEYTDAELSSSDGSCCYDTDGGAHDVVQGSNPPIGSSRERHKVGNPLGLLKFEYMERDPPYNREPLSDKISILASQFPELRTYQSCDLLPSSWISVAWYPIYRIPTGPTLQNLDASFLTFHSLSTSPTSRSTDWPHLHSSSVGEGNDTNMSVKRSLPIFGLASYKFNVSAWSPNGVSECQKVDSLMRSADNWLRLLQVDHPDYRFFVTRGS